MTKVLAPASKKQEMLLCSDADIIIYGGAVGGGKTYGGLLRHLRWINDPYYRGFIIRKHSVTLNKAGGVIDEAKSLYKEFDPRVVYKTKEMKFVWPSGAEIAFAHLDTEEDAEKFRGLQLSAAMIDEATQISEENVLVILSRLRTKAKMKTSLFLTCNPSPTSFIRRWIDWWITPKGEENAGRPNPERDGKIRWFIRQNNEMIWGDSKEELVELYGNRDENGVLYPDTSEKQHCRPLSLQFISATIFDNKPLLLSNPGYLASLQGLKRVKRERDLYGNWDIREEISSFFSRDSVSPVKYHEQDFVAFARAWDIAGSKPSETNPNPDYTAGVLMGKTREGQYVIIDVIRFRENYGEVIKRIVETAKSDPEGTKVVLPQDPGAAGKAVIREQLKYLHEEGIYNVSFMVVGGRSKVTRFQPLASAAENGLVSYIEDAWNEAFFDELEHFTGGRNEKNDQVDAAADSYVSLSTVKKKVNLSLGMNSTSFTKSSSLPF